MKRILNYGFWCLAIAFFGTAIWSNIETANANRKLADLSDNMQQRLDESEATVEEAE